MSSEGSDHQRTSPLESTPTAAKAFLCPHCTRRFGSNGALQRHTNGHHPAFDRCPMQCRFCPFLTSQRKEFFQHRRENHPDCSTIFYCCPLCNKMYRALGQYYDHCLVHLALNEYGEDQDMASVENLEVSLGEDSVDALRDTGPIEPVALPELAVKFPVADISASCNETPTNSTLVKSSISNRPRSNESSMASITPPPNANAAIPRSSNSPHVHQQQTHQCPYCPEKSQVPNWLQVHIYMCHGAMIPSTLQIMCGHCNLVETDSAKLRDHHQDHHADLPVTYCWRVKLSNCLWLGCKEEK